MHTKNDERAHTEDKQNATYSRFGHSNTNFFTRITHKYKLLMHLCSYVICVHYVFHYQWTFVLSLAYFFFITFFFLFSNCSFCAVLLPIIA